MTYITIEIPDNKIEIINTISDLLAKEGINTLVIDSDPELSEKEFSLLKESYHEALLIKSGKLNSIPFSDLWND